MVHPDQKLISLGYTYEGDGVYSRFVASNYSTWEKTDKPWDSSGTQIPWDVFGTAGYWDVKTFRDMDLKEGTNSKLVFKHQEFLNLLDIKFETPNVVLSDIEVGLEDISFEEFKRRLSNIAPVGYEESKPFYPGEYIYKEAIIGLQLRSNNADSKLGLYGAKVNVDIEDIVDKGTVIVPVEGITIEFSKDYYETPLELLFNVTQYTYPCNVEVVDKSEKSFTIKLKKISDGSYTTGTVSWMSNGY